MRLGLGVLFILISHTNQLEIRGDDSKNSLLITPYASINLYESAHYLLYTFDVYAIQYIVSWYKNLNEVCQNQSDILNPLRNEIETNMEWTLYNPFILRGENLYRIKFDLQSNILLEQNLNWFNSDIGKYRCLALEKLTQNFIRLNRSLNKLFKLNASAILEIMSLDILSIDVEQLLRNSSSGSLDFIYPFDFSKSFSERFFQFTRFSFYQNNYTVFLLFEIPSYEPVFLNRMHTIPIIINSNPFLLKTSQEFVISNHNRHFFYKNQTLDSHCFWSGSQRYCFRPSGNWSCELDHMKSIYTNTKCLKRLPRNNMITQIMSDTYFTVFKPLAVQVHCLNSEFMIQIRTSSKFINNWICSLNTSFFNYNQQNQTQGLFISLNDDIALEQLNMHFVSATAYLDYISIWLMAFVNVITLIIAFFYCKHLIEEARLKERVTIRLNGMFAPYVPSTHL